MDVRLGVRVSSLDRSAHTVELPDGAAVRYDKLLLATGSAPRRPPIPGSDAAGVHYLRSYNDAVALNSVLVQGLPRSGGCRLDRPGSGRQCASTWRRRHRRRDRHTTAAGRAREAVGKVFADLHRDQGVDLRLQTQLEEITAADGKATGLKMRDGSTVAADAVLVAVGAKPNVELAQQAGLAMGEGGVLVDASLRTSDPDIYAVGDIAAAEHPLLGTRVRTEHWANALKQPAVAAAGMLGRPGEYAELPYLFTDQYDLGMEYVGHAPSCDRVVFRGNVAGREFLSFWLDGDSRVLAGMNVNVWDVVDDVKGLIRSGNPVDVDRLVDPQWPLADLTTN